MPLSRRLALRCACASLFGGAVQARAASGLPPTTLTPGEALARLTEGNRRFVADAPHGARAQAARRATLAGGQGPYATVLGCADSRTPPNTLFDEGLGELFVLRVAGNTLSPAHLGSIEYSSLALSVPLVMVLGHERCGAVAAAVDVAERQVSLPGSLLAMVEPILPAVAEARQGNPADLVEATVRVHAIRTARRLREEPSALTPRLASGALRVVAARYDLDEGAVTLLDG
ncbi:carbonic anhydrase [Roseococcus sp. SYP-B2431]|uniref:carbonic anhydrase n=1 Tax=Roseococcus sp. SYP-B2431 TaxID=2496640 RepID=UPI0010400932|nr:carbonic anhydrase [Roseococcus sp. SYP-B2431]TCI00982.1 carbonic anhydrase [Roseococcus sp. SYP-B2431]